MKSPINITQLKEDLSSHLFALILVSSLIAQCFLPWWSIAVCSFGAAFWLAQSSGEAFAKGTAAIAIIWIAFAWLIKFTSAGTLSTQIASILPLKGHDGFLIIVGGLIAGLVGGVAAMSGFLCRKAV